MDKLKENIKNRPNDITLWCELGDLLIENNKQMKALKCYRRANELSPSNYVYEKIKKLEEELDIDTEDEDEYIDEKNNTTESCLGISSNKFFDLLLQNNFIKEKLSNPEFQNKILQNSENPSIIFEDNEILSVMKEMHNVYKKKS